MRQSIAAAHGGGENAEKIAWFMTGVEFDLPEREWAPPPKPHPEAAAAPPDPEPVKASPTESPQSNHEGRNAAAAEEWRGERANYGEERPVRDTGPTGRGGVCETRALRGWGRIHSLALVARTGDITVNARFGYAGLYGTTTTTS